MNENIETNEITFDDFGFDDQVMEGLDAMNFVKPSPIQEAAIPVIMSGHDVIACAQTGTGKTAAFVLPLLSKLTTGKYSHDHINAIIMSPTRELAQQIDQQIDAFSYFVNVSAVAVYGGTGGVEWEQQKRGMKMGADIVVATPGRLLSMMGLTHIDFSQVSFFILDEADRMLDMGFYDDILEVYKQLPPTVQTIMFSATMPPKIRKMAKAIMKNPEEVNIAISRPPETIQQSAYLCQDADKMTVLTEIFKRLNPARCITFFASKDKVKQAFRTLYHLGYKVTEMHSDLPQAKREEVMNDFKAGRISIIVATDIISRGIDVDDIDLVINYDVPTDPEDYVHRIGRTARGSSESGMAITIVSERDLRYYDAIEEFLGYNIKVNDLPEGCKILDRSKSISNGRGAQGRSNKNNRNPKSKRTGKENRSNRPKPNSGQAPSTPKEKSQDPTRQQRRNRGRNKYKSEKSHQVQEEKSK